MICPPGTTQEQKAIVVVIPGSGVDCNGGLQMRGDGWPPDCSIPKLLHSAKVRRTLIRLLFTVFTPQAVTVSYATCRIQASCHQFNIFPYIFSNITLFCLPFLHGLRVSLSWDVTHCGNPSWTSHVTSTDLDVSLLSTYLSTVSWR